eukprot:1110127-Prorocentrum_minimum.AAC.5
MADHVGSGVWGAWGLQVRAQVWGRCNRRFADNPKVRGPHMPTWRRAHRASKRCVLLLGASVIRFTLRSTDYRALALRGLLTVQATCLTGHCDV